MKIIIRRCLMVALLLSIVACAAQNSGGGSLKPGMTTDETIAAMGQPDLKDNVPSTDHNGPGLLRYTWLGAGEAAIFGPDMKVENIVNVGPSPATLREAEEQKQPSAPFDPIETPLDYIFYPFKAAVVVIFTGLNCVGGGGCHAPQLPPVNRG